jgi:hypothetical protein
MMRKDLRCREELRQSNELAEVTALPEFDDVDVVDLRQMAELIECHADGSITGITIERAHAFGRSSRHKYQCVQRALRWLLGPDHSATQAVVAARSLHGRKKSRRANARYRDARPRHVILTHDRWQDPKLRSIAEEMPIMELRAVDRFDTFCEAKHVDGESVDDFLEFVADKTSSMLLRTLRDGLEKLYTSAHPAIALVETARGLKEKQRLVRLAQKRKIIAPAVAALPRAKVSLPPEALPHGWRTVLDDLAVGHPARGMILRPRSVETLRCAVGQLGWSAQQAGLPLEMNLNAIRAYDQDLRKRNNRASSRQIHFTALHSFGRALGADPELLKHLSEAAAYCGRLALADVKLKEGRLDRLPQLAEIFRMANELLDEAATVTDRRRLATLRTDAGALAFLSLLPLRSQDTLLKWGVQITFHEGVNPLEQEAPRMGYYRLNLMTSKTGSRLSGPLAPILTPFLDALILQGRDATLLPALRHDAMKRRDPVFPKSNGGMRSPRSLAERWRVRVGTGSIISRTQIHTLLGELGERGVRAALALCAQSSKRTAAWYQSEALGRRRMALSQELLDGLIGRDISGVEGAAACPINGVVNLVKP